MFRILFCLFILAGACGSNNDVRYIVCNHTAKILKCVEYVRNYDGDTITVNIPGLHPLIGKNIGIRVAGIDTPEIKGKTKCESLVALKAKVVVSDIMRNAESITLKNVKRGHYFRIVADVYADQRNVGDHLLRLGYAYKYNGGRKRTDIDWCEKL